MSQFTDEKTEVQNVQESKGPEHDLVGRSMLRKLGEEIETVSRKEEA